jgi:hypothetical protein
MRFNILVGLILPWILGIGLLKKHKELIKIVPYVWALATFLNVWGGYHKFWVVEPKLTKRQYLTTMPYNFGLYPVLSVFMNYFIKKTKKKFFGIMFFSFLTTVAEFCMVLLKKVRYGNGWNIVKTFFSYVVTYYLIYRYYLWKHSFR